MKNQYEATEELIESMHDDADYIKDLSYRLDDLNDAAEEYIGVMDRYGKSASKTKNLLRIVSKYL